jgi:hypothetical protein
VLFGVNQAAEYVLRRVFLDLRGSFDMHPLFDLALENLCEITLSQG